MTMCTIGKWENCKRCLVYKPVTISVCFRLSLGLISLVSSMLVAVRAKCVNANILQVNQYISRYTVF